MTPNPIIDKAMPYIEAALEYGGGTHHAEDVVRSILKGDLVLWAGDNSAVVTEIEHYPQKKICNVFLAGGDIEELKLMGRDIEAWAKSRGCSRITIAGRRGWGRALLGEGYRPQYHVTAKEIA